MVKIANFKRQINKKGIIGIDSSVFIYKFEQNKQFESLCSVIFDKLSENKITLIASVISVAKILARPFELADQPVIHLYETVFSQLPNFKLVSLDYDLTREAAKLRADYNILLPDALQIAACLKYKAEIFVTNNKKLKKVKDIKIVCLKDYV